MDYDGLRWTGVDSTMPIPDVPTTKFDGQRGSTISFNVGQFRLRATSSSAPPIPQATNKSAARRTTTGKGHPEAAHGNTELVCRIRRRFGFLLPRVDVASLVSRFSFPGVPNVDSTGWYSSSGSTEMKNPLNNNNKDDQPRPRSSPSRSARADSAVEFLRISWCITLHHPSSPLIARLCFVYTVCRASRAWQARRGSWPRSPRDPRSR